MTAECTECGFRLDPSWKFCIHCGAPTGVSDEVATVAPTPVAARINPVAVLGLVLGLVASPLAAVFGIVALVQLRRGGGRGRLLAIIATVLGIGWTAIAVLAIVTFATTGGVLGIRAR